jgi:riboflavin-specific deaminase-like protein
MPEGALNRASTAIPCLVESVLKEHTEGVTVTVSWAQSSNGAIAPLGGPRVILSSPESMTLTHQLRGLHQGILVGIGTVLADDPQLTVRFVDGPSPQPVVLDSALRFPDSARLLSRTDHAPWIFHALDAPDQRRRELERRGAQLFALPAAEDGLPLDEVLRFLAERGVSSLMVEGGARVLRSFISKGLAHQAVISVSPIFIEGIHVFETMTRSTGTEWAIGFTETSEQSCGPDTITWGRIGAAVGRGSGATS